MTDSNITFLADGAPYSKAFDDIYFDTSHGCQQSWSVFIDGNHIEQRLRNHDKTFVIAETGFGTGLNFLLTWQLFEKIKQEQTQLAITANKPQQASTKITGKLHFISVEKYPLTQAQLRQSLAIFPELKMFSEQLIAQYPDKLTDNITLSFANNSISLQLIIADAATGFANVNAPEQVKYLPIKKSNPLVDAWYLDGFSPAKNPDMWRTELFQQITRLSKPQATLATFTVAGHIKRSLINAGFRIKKQRAKGKKSEILSAVFQQNPNTNKGYQLRPIVTKPQHVSIIGGGIAAACAAYVLTNNGIKVTLYCQDEAVAQGASSNAIGALYPLIHQQQDQISLFYQTAFNYAVTFYQNLLKQGANFDHDWCGLLEISYKSALHKRQQQFQQDNLWSNELVQSIDSKTASIKANISLTHGGLFYPKAGWLAPAQLVQQLFKLANNSNRLRIHTQCKINKIVQQSDGKWRLESQKKSYQASVVVYCGGANGIDIDYIKSLPLTPVRGQVTSVASKPETEKLATVICHKGYLTPANNQQHCLGATFDKNSLDSRTTAKDDQYNMDMLAKCLPELNFWDQNDITTSKARSRCMTPDHLPIVGAMPDIPKHQALYAHLSKDKNWRYHEQAPVINGLFMLTGLGARGLCTAPLLAKILNADICGTPYPLNNDELFNLAPNRFIIRNIIKSE